MDARLVSPLARREKAAARPPILALALGAGLLTASTAYFALQSLSAHPAPAPQTVAMREVVVASRDIPARTVLTPALLQTRTVAVNSVPAETATLPHELVGQVTTLSIPVGSPITHQMTAHRDINMGMAYALPPTMRAVAIPLDPVSGVAGFVRPGDHVDVLATFTEADNQAVTRTILQNVTLLATGTRIMPGYSRPENGQKEAGSGGGEASQNMPAKPEEMPNATLMVRMEEAPRLVLASAKGKLQLVLRPADDPSRTSAMGMASIGLGGEASPKASAMRVLQTPSPALAAAPISSPRFPSSAPPKTLSTPTVKPEYMPHMAKLLGVIGGQNACATISLDDKSYLAQVGETLFGYKITRVFDTGILVSVGRQKSMPWLVGGSRPVSDAFGSMTAENKRAPAAADSPRALPDI